MIQIKRYKETKKTGIWPDEDPAAGCLLHYQYIKNNCKVWTIYFSREKVLDSETKIIQQIELAVELKSTNNNVQWKFILSIIEKIKETELKSSQGTVSVL